MDVDEGSVSLAEQYAEVCFPAWPPPLWTATAVTSILPRLWATQREAVKAAASVAGLVGVPAAIAAIAALTLFGLAFVVLLAPAVAVGLTWLAWRCDRRPSTAGAGPAHAGARGGSGGSR